MRRDWRNRLFFESRCLRMSDFDASLVCTRRPYGDGDVILRQERRDALRPFNCHHATLLEQFRETDGFEILRTAHAIRVQVKHLQPTGVINVEKNKRRTADGTNHATQTLDEP